MASYATYARYTPLMLIAGHYYYCHDMPFVKDITPMPAATLRQRLRHAILIRL